MQFYGDLNLAIEEIIHLPLVYGNNFYHDTRMACREIYFEQEGVFENQYKLRPPPPPKHFSFYLETPFN